MKPKSADSITVMQGVESRDFFQAEKELLANLSKMTTIFTQNNNLGPFG